MALIVAVLVSIVLLFRWMIKSFYQTGRGRKETLEAGVEEKTESIAYREKRKRAQLFIGIEPSAKIRRAYKKNFGHLPENLLVTLFSSAKHGSMPPMRKNR